MLVVKTAREIRWLFYSGGLAKGEVRFKLRILTR